MADRQGKIAFLRRVFGGLTVSGDSVNIAVICPRSSCASRKKGKRKLSIRVDTDQSHCWVCGLKTRNTLLPVLRLACSRDEIQEYVEKFAARPSHLTAEDAETSSDEERVTLPEDFRLLGMHLSSREPAIRRALNYLRRRGFTDPDLWRFRVGISAEGRFQRRVIIPSFDVEGGLNTYAARGVDRDAFPPYLIPSVERIGIIFNEIDIDWKRELTLVEGPLDLMKCVGNAACLQGSTLSEDHLLFWRIVSNCTPIVLALDADAKKKSFKIANLLASYDIPVRIMDLGGFADVGEMDRKSYVHALDKARPWSSAESLRMKIDAWSSTSL